MKYIKRNNKKVKGKKKKIIKKKNDIFFKKMMSYPDIAKSFLDRYLISEFKALIDLSTIHTEQESFIDDELKTNYSDVVFSVKTKDENQAYVYTVLVEHQSTVYYWFMLRLWRYIISLCEKHKQKHGNKKVKLPLIYPLLISNANKPYDAPLNLSELFYYPKMAQKLMFGDCSLIDLYKLSDEEIVKNNVLGIMEYMLKHIRDRNLIKMMEEFFDKFSIAVELDRKQDFIYTSKVLCYIREAIPEDKKEHFQELLLDKLSSKEGEEVMRSIADVEREELREELDDTKLISKVTGYNLEDIVNIKNEAKV
ncbi:MAG: Rpn family recombination-promoting nuclease/putative transposase [Rickettsiaceae bacterium]|nr:Rpn family recombination-promoting nuclease/putative transposase [Rickettsiaceae bacterium]